MRTGMIGLDGGNDVSSEFIVHSQVVYILNDLIDMKTLNSEL